MRQLFNLVVLLAGLNCVCCQAHYAEHTSVGVASIALFSALVFIALFLKLIDAALEQNTTVRCVGLIACGAICFGCAQFVGYLGIKLLLG